MPFTIETNTTFPIVIPDATATHDGLLTAALYQRIVDGPSMQEIYDASPGYETNMFYTVNNTFGGGLFIEDAATPINTDSLFGVQNADISNSFGVQGDAFGFAAFLNRGNITTNRSIGLFVQTTAAADASTTVRHSPGLRFVGRAWNTVSLASQSLRFNIYDEVVSGNPISGTLTFYGQINAGTERAALGMNNTGTVFINGATSVGSGEGVLSIANATVVPTTNPTGGGLLYANAGALVWRGSAGTVTPIAPA